MGWDRSMDTKNPGAIHGERPKFPWLSEREDFGNFGKLPELRQGKEQGSEDGGSSWNSHPREGKPNPRIHPREVWKWLHARIPPLPRAPRARSQLVSYGLMDYQGRKIPTLSRKSNFSRSVCIPAPGLVSFLVRPAQPIPGQSSQTSATTGSFSRQIRKWELIILSAKIGFDQDLFPLWILWDNWKRSKLDFTSLY